MILSMLYSTYYCISEEGFLKRRPGKPSKWVPRYLAVSEMEGLPPIAGTDVVAVIKLVAKHEREFEAQHNPPKLNP